MQLANRRARRVNCITTYVPRCCRNATTMPSHEITHYTPRHDIPYHVLGLYERARSIPVILHRKEELGSRHSFTCSATSPFSANPPLIYCSLETLTVRRSTIHRVGSRNTSLIVFDVGIEAFSASLTFPLFRSLLSAGVLFCGPDYRLLLN